MRNYLFCIIFSENQFYDRRFDVGCNASNSKYFVTNCLRVQYVGGLN